jgi:superfamily I DNA/RNA helicase
MVVFYDKQANRMTTQDEIATVCDAVKSLLLEKNRRYGNSALEPVRIFSKSDSIEQILVRIDDKLSRIQKGAGLFADNEDVIQDLIGYLILLKIAFDKQENSQGLYDPKPPGVSFQ